MNPEVVLIREEVGLYVYIQIYVFLYLYICMYVWIYLYIDVYTVGPPPVCILNCLHLEEGRPPRHVAFIYVNPYIFMYEWMN